MVARREPTRQVDKVRAFAFLQKAGEFFTSMQQNLAAGRWNATGLDAVHCAISACDAVLVYYTERRSASPDHETAAYLLEALTQIPDAKRKAETLKRIVGEKHMVEYEDRAVTAEEAATLAKLTERFYLWAREVLPGERP